VQAAGMWAIEGTHSPQSIMCIHSVLALVALMVTNATGAHAMARAAHRSGEKPARAAVDDLESKGND
jgi:multicomponent Na+:H+ antiporter subunit G